RQPQGGVPWQPVNPAATSPGRPPATRRSAAGCRHARACRRPSRAPNTAVSTAASCASPSATRTACNRCSGRSSSTSSTRNSWHSSTRKKPRTASAAASSSSCSATEPRQMASSAPSAPLQGDPDLPAQVQRLGPWFHNLHLPGGVQTAPVHYLGGDFPAFKWQQIAPHIPADLSGWSVLDIGCNAGFYSFELARRGADVTAIDMDPHYLRQARWAADVLGLSGRVAFRQAQVHALAREQERYDLVWFMGVLYHLRHPLL